jgi:cation diffusion facilitator family transporter
MTASTTELKNAEKIRWARISIWSNVFLTVLKLAVGAAMFSISVLSEAVHSGMDLIAAIIANLAVIISARPPDKDHAYGHGKYENLSAMAEATLIFVAAAIIIIESILKILHPAQIGFLYAGIAVMGISTLVNIAVSRKLMKVAKRTDSAALEADALHLSTDVWTSVGVFAGLILIRVTGIYILDPFVALLVAVLIIHAAWELVSRSGRDLADSSLPEKELSLIKDIVSRHRDKYVEFHGLRARKAGAQRHIDLHLVLARETHVDDAHELCDSIEDEIKKELDGSEVLVHIEPCAHQCDECATRPGCKAALEDSLACGLSEQDWKAISDVLERHRCSLAGYQNLRIRRDGHRRRLDLELLVARDTAVERAHDTADMVASEIERALADTSVNVHLEPCKTGCPDCDRLPSCSAGNKVI